MSKLLLSGTLLSTSLLVLLALLKSVVISLFYLLIYYLGSLIHFWKFDSRFFWVIFAVCVIWSAFKIIKNYRRNNLFSILVGGNPDRAVCFFKEYNESIMFSGDSVSLNYLYDGNMYLFTENGNVRYFKFTTDHNKEGFYVNSFIKLIR